MKKPKDAMEAGLLGVKQFDNLRVDNLDIDQHTLRESLKMKGNET